MLTIMIVEWVGKRVGMDKKNPHPARRVVTVQAGCGATYFCLSSVPVGHMKRQ